MQSISNELIDLQLFDMLCFAVLHCLSKYDFHNFVFSMKASNPLVMVQAYRLLAAEQYR